jgi:threonylcarbamoyladenosine tRNA methylthiotransferase MtaB
MRVFLTSLGCKLNQAETEAWTRRLAATGSEVVADPADADLCVVNTCTVTHEAARKSRQLVRRCSRANPQAQVVVAGCYAEISASEASQLPGVRLVLGSAAKDHLVESLAAHFDLPSTECRDGPAHVTARRTRAFVKIQDGCDNACTYCIVRVARGRQRSRPMAEVLEEISLREREGYQEIVLTGVHIGAYGRDCGGTLAGLIRTILDQTRFARLRLSSVEPWDMSSALLQLWHNPRLCHHLHLPLQSGCDATLHRMNRRYTTAQYRDLVAHARQSITDLAVSTDVIVGFPGETAEEFAAGARFVADTAFARIHVFPFSARPGTAAAEMPEQVSPEVKEERKQRMLAIARESANSFHHRFLGRTMDVLWESPDGERWSGLTGNYIRVETMSADALHNRILPARLVELTAEGMRGELL